MNKNAADAGISSEAASSSLTWQQQLMNDSLSSRKTRKEPHAREKRETKTRKSKPDKSTPADTLHNQTWQQELFNQAQSRNSAYDFAADARDRETFGEGTSRSKSAANTQETRKKKGKTRVVIKTPKTSNEKITTTMAYAGPTFHNSPHAASLPAPTFQGKPRLGSADEDDATPDLSESETGEDSVIFPSTNSEAASKTQSGNNTATQQPLNASQTGPRLDSDRHVRKPMELLQQALANHAQSSKLYNGTVPANNVLHHQSVPSPGPSPASNRPHPSTTVPSGYSSSPLPSNQNGIFDHPRTNVVNSYPGARDSRTQAHPKSLGGPNQAITTLHDKYADRPISAVATPDHYQSSSSMQPTSSSNSVSNSPILQRSEATSRSNTPTTQFQSVDNLLSRMLNSSSLLQR